MLSLKAAKKLFTELNEDDSPRQRRKQLRAVDAEADSTTKLEEAAVGDRRSLQEVSEKAACAEEPVTLGGTASASSSSGPKPLRRACFQVGDTVLYWSATYRVWLPGLVQAIRNNGRLYDLDVKKGARAEHVKANPKSTGERPTVAPEAALPSVATEILTPKWGMSTEAESAPGAQALKPIEVRELLDEPDEELARKTGEVTVRRMVGSARALMKGLEVSLVMRAGILAASFYRWRCSLVLAQAQKTAGVELPRKEVVQGEISYAAITLCCTVSSRALLGLIFKAWRCLSVSEHQDRKWRRFLQGAIARALKTNQRTTLTLLLQAWRGACSGRLLDGKVVSSGSASAASKQRRRRPAEAVLERVLLRATRCSLSASLAAWVSAAKDLKIERLELRLKKQPPPKALFFGKPLATAHPVEERQRKVSVQLRFPVASIAAVSSSETILVAGEEQRMSRSSSAATLNLEAEEAPPPPRPSFGRRFR